MRVTYWYYLEGANQTSFNVSILPDRLNYVITYTNLGNNYQVNCDLLKQTWTPSLNSFVKLVSTTPTSFPQPQSNSTLAISLSTKASLDLAALNSTVNPPKLPSPAMVVITSLPQPSLTVNNPN
jgi:elongation factor P hydroxylase